MENYPLPTICFLTEQTNNRLLLCFPPTLHLISEDDWMLEQHSHRIKDETAEWLFYFQEQNIFLFVTVVFNTVMQCHNQAVKENASLSYFILKTHPTSPFVSSEEWLILPYAVSHMWLTGHTKLTEPLTSLPILYFLSSSPLYHYSGISLCYWCLMESTVSNPRFPLIHPQFKQYGYQTY